MADKQVLFRLDEGLLDRLDSRISKNGYNTRNAWFKDMVHEYLGEERNPRRELHTSRSR